MYALLGLSTIASLAVSATLGVRLLRLWRRSRQTPELAIGASFLLAGVFGYLATIVGNPAAAASNPERTHALLVIGLALISCGVSLSYLFVWKVFRPASRSAQALFWLATGALAVTVVPLSGNPTAPAEVGPLTALGDLVRIGGGVWGAFESLRYYTIMRRRLRIGLAEPALTNRFLLWGLGCVATAAIFLATSTQARQLLVPADLALTPGIMILVSLFTLTTATAQWLAFLPPSAYLRWIAGRAPRTQGAA
jgi:hypothetical protein